MKIPWGKALLLGTLEGRSVVWLPLAVAMTDY